MSGSNGSESEARRGSERVREQKERRLAGSRTLITRLRGRLKAQGYERVKIQSSDKTGLNLEVRFKNKGLGS